MAAFSQSACPSVRPSVSRREVEDSGRQGGRDHRGASRPFSCLHRPHKSFCYRTACQPGVNRPPAKSATIWRPRGAIAAHGRAALRAANDPQRPTPGSSCSPGLLTMGKGWSEGQPDYAGAVPCWQHSVRHEVAFIAGRCVPHLFLR